MSDITKAIQTLCDEKALSYETVMETIETALAAAYRKDFGNKQQNIKVKFNPEAGDMQAWDVKTVVDDISEDVLTAAQEELTKRREQAKAEDRELTDEEIADLPHFNPKLELMLAQAKEVSKKAKVGDVLEIPLEIPGAFGRMAAQTAKQVIIQKIREAERNMVFDDFKQQEGQLVTGIIQRVEGRKVLVDFGKVVGVLPSDQQIGREHYRPGGRMKFFVLSVNLTARGPEIILSRNSPNMVREVFKQEIPEIGHQTVEIKGVARDAGFRSKVAVASSDKSVDPIGSCIGQRGSRINTIIEELGGEKIDIVSYNDAAVEYITNALSPAKVLRVELSEENKNAEVYVAPDQFSLAIGRSGQNVRLASELTGWQLNIKEEGGTQEMSSEQIEGEAEIAGETTPAEAESETPAVPESEDVK